MVQVLWALIAVNSILKHQDLTPAISFRSAAEVAGSLSQELAATVEVQRDLRDQQVAVLRNNAKASDILQGLASGLHASVVHEGKVILIRRNKTDQDALVALDHKFQVEAIRRRLASWEVESPPTLPAASLAEKVVEAINHDLATMKAPRPIPGVVNTRGVDPVQFTPAGRLLHAIILKIGVEELATLPPNGTRVYSNDPTPVENPLSGVEDLLETFAAEQKTFRGSQVPKVVGADLTRSLDESALPDPTLALDGLRFVLTVRRYSVDAAKEITPIRISLFVANSAGRRVAMSTFFTGSRDNGLPWQRAIIAGAVPASSTVDLTPDQTQFADAITPRARPMPVGNRLWQVVLNPEKVDIANALVPSALATWITSEPKPAIAVITDQAILAAFYSVKQGHLNTDIFDKLLNDTCEKVNINGIFILRSKDPVATESATCSRSTLGQAVRRFVGQGQVDLRGWSTLLYKLGDGYNPIVPQMMRLIQANGIKSFISKGMFTNDVFQVIGCTTPDQWDVLESGHSVRLTGEALCSKLWTYALNDGISAATRGQQGDIFQYPTKLFPKGIPPDTEMMLTPIRELTLKSNVHFENGFVMPMDARAFAKMYHHSFDRPGANDSSSPERQRLGFGSKALDNLASNGTFFLGFTSQVEAVAVFPNGEKIEWVLPYSHEDSDQPLKFADLPKEYRDAVYNEWQKLEPKDPLLP